MAHLSVACNGLQRCFAYGGKLRADDECNSTAMRATATAAGREGSDRLLRAYLCVGVSHSGCFRLRCHKVLLCAAVFTMPCLQQCAHFSRWLSVLNPT
jgi:hypothetical protein